MCLEEDKENIGKFKLVRNALSYKERPLWHGSSFSSNPIVNISSPCFPSGRVAYPASSLCANAETSSLCH
ncbi:hypothetical protein INR49_028500, partial [Caranx melampygus]